MQTSGKSSRGRGDSRRNPKLGATVRDRIAEVLRDEIISGKLSKGMRIDLDETAAELGTSRTPVREACLVLVHEGLVEVAPRTGVSVVGLTPRDVEDNFALMAVLSGTAAAWASERGTPEQHKEIRLLSDEVRAAADAGGDIRTANFLFHRAINRASNSARLLILLRQTGRLIPTSYFDMIPEQASCALREHDDIVAAVIAGDPEKARRLSEEHLVRAGRAFVLRMFGERESSAVEKSG